MVTFENGRTLDDLKQGDHWRAMIIGGLRSGKSTIAAGLIANTQSAVLGKDQLHGEYLRRAFKIPDSVPYISSSMLPNANVDEDLRGDVLWIDEDLYDYQFHPLARRFRRILWTVFPHEHLQETGFYKECKRTGFVAHMPMREEFQPMHAKAIGSQLSEDEVNRRLTGQF